MPLKLNIAISGNVGERHYGSRGATAGLELEVDFSLMDQRRALHQRIARLFRLAKASMDRELAVHVDSSNRAGAGTPNLRRATANQIRAIHAIAQRQELVLGEEVTRFGVLAEGESRWLGTPRKGCNSYSGVPTVAPPLRSFCRTAGEGRFSGKASRPR